MINKSQRVITLVVIVLVLAALACSGSGSKPEPTQPPSPTPASPAPPPATKIPKPTTGPTRTPKASPTPAASTEAQFYALEFASEVISDTDGLRTVDPGESFFDISEINAVWEYEGVQDGVDFQRIWSLEGETILDKTTAWNGGDSGVYHLSLQVDSGTLDPGLYSLELYYDGNLMLSGEFEIRSGPPPLGVTLYEDDFEDDASGWDIDDSDNATVGYQDGQYAITVKMPEWLAWANPNADLDLENVMIEVETTLDRGPKDDVGMVEFGIICRYVNSNNFYYFVIRADGQAAIFKVENDEQVMLSSDDEDYTPSPAIRQGLVSNRVRAMCTGSTLELYVNDEQVAAAEDSALVSGDVGLIVGTFDEGNVKVLFDNLTVIEPQ